VPQAKFTGRTRVLCQGCATVVLPACARIAWRDVSPDQRPLTPTWSMSDAKGVARRKSCVLRQLAPRSWRLLLRWKVTGNSRWRWEVRTTQGENPLQLTLKVQPRLHPSW